MKKFMMLSALCMALLLAASTTSTVVAQDMPGMDKSPMDMAYFPARAAFRAFEKDADKKAKMAPVMRVIYSRPQKNGREIMGNLIKEGEVWRVGANESAELDLMKAVTVGGTKLKPGRYTIYTKIDPGSKKWTLLVNSDLDGWGAYAYNEANNVASVEGVTSNLEEEVEAFTMMFKAVDGGTHMVMAWGKGMVEFPIMMD